MRSVKGKRLATVLCAASLAVAASARADVSVEKGSSILIFPKIIADGTRDTVISLANISNDLVFARCFYVNAQLTIPGVPEHPILNPPLWLETDFQIRLTRQQPTQWFASYGRPVDPFDTCLPEDLKPTCYPVRDVAALVDGHGFDFAGLGIDPGAVPPLPPDFVGELKCVEVDAAGTPIGGNHLKGEATIRDIPQRIGIDISKYNAIGIAGTDLAGATGNDLHLDNPSNGAPQGQYDACPAETILNHFAEGAEDPVIVAGGAGRRCAENPGTLCTDDGDCGDTPCVVGGVCSDNEDPCTENSDCTEGATCLLAGIGTELTVVPCSQDFENQQPAEVTIQFLVYNEFEARFSTSTSVICWKNIRLQDIGNTNVFDVAVLGSDVAQTFLTPADQADGGFVAVAESFRRNALGEQARAAMNVHTRGDRLDAADGFTFDHIVLPDAQ
jgi:hypothetical protein